MSFLSLLNAVELGAIFGIVAVAVYISFRVLDFPDLTVDGSFATGAAVAAALITAGTNPWLASVAAFISGIACGLITAVLNRKFGMLHLLAGILTTIALFSIDLRIMGRPNIPLMGEQTILTPFAQLGVDEAVTRAVLAVVLAFLIAILLGKFLLSEHGLALRASGANSRMAQANGISVDNGVYSGVGLSNGIVALAGAVFAQFIGFADVGVGTGTIIFGLAAVILGESLLRTKRIYLALFACIIGSILYRIAVSFALNVEVLGLRSSDLRLVTAILVAVAFISSKRRGQRKAKKARALQKKIAVVEAKQ